MPRNKSSIRGNQHPYQKSINPFWRDSKLYSDKAKEYFEEHATMFMAEVQRSVVWRKRPK